MDGLCQPRQREPSERQKMKSMTELAGGEYCLAQRPHNQVGAARKNVHRLSMLIGFMQCVMFRQQYFSAACLLVLIRSIQPTRIRHRNNERPDSRPYQYSGLTIRPKSTFIRAKYLNICFINTYNVYGQGRASFHRRHSIRTEN